MPGDGGRRAVAVTVAVTAAGAVSLAVVLGPAGRVPVTSVFVAVALPVAAVRVPVLMDPVGTVVVLMDPVGAVAVAACGAGAAGLLRRIRGRLRRGHRPIIARTKEAPCSPRPK